MKILITGSTGMLGKAVTEYFKKKHKVIQADRNRFDLSKKNLTKYLSNKENRVDYIIHCAAYTNVDKSETDLKNLKKINVEAIKIICNFCNKSKTKLIYPQTFMVMKSTKNIYHSDSSKIFDIFSFDLYIFQLVNSHLLPNEFQY